MPTPNPSQLCSFSSTSLKRQPVAVEQLRHFAGRGDRLGLGAAPVDGLGPQRLDPRQHPIEIGVGRPRGTAEPGDADPAPNLRQHGIDPGRRHALAQHLVDLGRERIQRDQADADAGGGPALDGLDLDRQHALVGPGEWGGLDGAGQRAAGQGLEQILLGQELAHGPHLRGRRIGASLGRRPGERHGVDRTVLGTEQKAFALALGRAVEAGNLGRAEADDMAEDRLGTAVGVGQAAAAGTHARCCDGQGRLVERRRRARGHHGITLDDGDAGRDRQPLAAFWEMLVDQPETLGSGEVGQPPAPQGVRRLDPEHAEGGAPQRVEGGALVGVGRRVLAGEAVDRRGPAGRRGEQADVQRQRQRVGDRGAGPRIVPAHVPPAEPVPCGLLDLGPGQEIHRRQAQLAHQPAQALRPLLQARLLLRCPPSRRRPCHFPLPAAPTH